MNPLFNNSNGINNLLGLLSGNPNQLLMNMLQTNPQFRQFYEANKNKTPEQIAKENGIDFNAVRNALNQNKF